MTGYQWAWSRFRILRIVFVVLLIVGFSSLVPTSVPQYDLAIEILWGVTTLLLGRYVWKWKYPRCRELFGGKGGNRLLPPKQCAYLDNAWV